MARAVYRHAHAEKRNGVSACRIRHNHAVLAQQQWQRSGAALYFYGVTARMAQQQRQRQQPRARARASHITQHIQPHDNKRLRARHARRLLRTRARQNILALLARMGARAYARARGRFTFPLPVGWVGSYKGGYGCLVIPHILVWFLLFYLICYFVIYYFILVTFWLVILFYLSLSTVIFPRSFGSILFYFAFCLYFYIFDLDLILVCVAYVSVM